MLYTKYLESLLLSCDKFKSNIFIVMWWVGVGKIYTEYVFNLVKCYIQNSFYFSSIVIEGTGTKLFFNCLLIEVIGQLPTGQFPLG